MKIISRLVPVLFTIFLLTYQGSPVAAETKTSTSQGGLDTTFGEGGLVTTDLNRDSQGYSVALQTDGKIVVVGSVVSTVSFTMGGYQRDSTLLRYNSNGSLDTTFGEGGKIVMDFISDDHFTKVIVQSDGKIFAGGPGNNGNCDMARFLPNGSPDDSFGTGGKVTLYVASNCAFERMAIQNDGKYIVPIFNQLARFNSDGSLDTAFGTDGFVSMSAGTAMYFNGLSVGLQEDGKILVGGAVCFDIHGYDCQSVLVRYDSNGSPDTTFGTAGATITAFDGRNWGSILLVEPNGRIILAGSYSNTSDTSELSMTRFNPDGSVDTTFGNGGRSLLGLGDIGYFSNLVYQDNKIIAVIDNFGDFRGDFMVARFTDAGSVDLTFGQGGLATLDLGGRDGSEDGLLLPDGRIIVAGYTVNDLYDNTALVRFTAEGLVDAAFGTDGQAITTFTGSFNSANAVATQADGKTVVGGQSSGGRTSLLSLTRYNSNGSLDETFGRNGISLTKIADKNSAAKAVILQPDQKIVVAGGTVSPSLSYFDFFVARYRTDGTLDPDFGDSGVVLTSPGINRGGANGVALQADGKIVAAGWAISGLSPITNYNFALVRYDSDGSLDAEFGDGGIVITDFLNNVDQATSVVIQPDGKILLAGYAYKQIIPSTYDTDFALARYNTDGTLDPTFDEDGKVSTDFGEYDFARAITLQEDGKILVAGDSDSTAILVRYNSDGSLDETFGGSANRGGLPAGAIVVSDTGYDSAKSLLLDFEEKIVVSGYSQDNYLVARFNQDGSADENFGINGKINTDFGGDNDEAHAMVLTGLRVLVAGFTNRNDNPDISAARYWLVPPRFLFLPFISR